MTADKIKELLDACYLAKRCRDLLPSLPKGVAPSYIQYLDVIRKLEHMEERVKVSDVSEALRLPRPGVTRTIREMEEKGYLTKTSSAEDGRITYVAITEKGQSLHQKYDREYFHDLSGYTDSISNEDAERAIRTLKEFYQIMCERSNRYE